MKFGFKVINDSELPPIKNARLLDAQAIGEALMEIDQSLERVEPKKIVDNARAKDSPMHAAFEWDDSVAAEAHRLQQARALVRCITILPTPKEARKGIGERPAFLSIRADDGERGYRPLEVVLTSSEFQLRVLADAERDLLAWENRYKMLVDICEIVRGARERIAEKRAKGKKGEGDATGPEVRP